MGRREFQHGSGVEQTQTVQTWIPWWRANLWIGTSAPWGLNAYHNGSGAEAKARGYNGSVAKTEKKSSHVFGRVLGSGLQDNRGSDGAKGKPVGFPCEFIEDVWTRHM